ncbi:hypothetical protein C1D09_018785 [Mesorhizobium intechi]|uniref:Uncharacterized protein n=1 Tax=Mesorhizobium intechi TaxID=537601 RepID=A0A8T9ANY8_9HYPH|nr:hypothetical protein [Mesorhizobium intechi]TSE07579.1 hypothetical protein C1D09_018785 [Mesorhizobium intechi]
MAILGLRQWTMDGPYIFAGGPPANPVTYVGKFSGGPSGNTLTYASAPIATSASDIVVIGLVRESNFGTTTTGVTVGGTAAALWSPGAITLGFISAGYIEFYYCQPGALATADIVATFGANVINGNILAWAVSGATATPLDAVSSAQASSASIALNDIETKVNGAVIAVGVCEPTITGWTESWSGSETVVEDADFTSATGNHRIVACHFATTAALTTQDLTLTLAASQAHIGGAISFGP